MSKIDLVLHPDEFTSFKSNYLESLFGDYFQILIFDKTKKYSRQTLFATNLFGDKSWAKELKSNGYKVAVDNLWERPVPTEFYSIQNPNWFWYNESLWYQDLGYHTYKPNKTYSKLAFMPMRMKRYSRDQLLTQLHPYLDNMIYSYVEKGIYLPNDAVSGLSTTRYFNSEWYDNTYFSVVAESIVDNVGEVFVTEKTFKPIAFWHPFIVYGQPGVLKFIKNLGFETFENLFDESYDQWYEIYHKLPLIEKCIRDFAQVEYDKTTWEKLEHNKNLFFNNSIVEQRFINEIVNPIIEYVESQ